MNKLFNNWWKDPRSDSLMLLGKHASLRGFSDKNNTRLNLRTRWQSSLILDQMLLLLLWPYPLVVSLLFSEEVSVGGQNGVGKNLRNMSTLMKHHAMKQRATSQLLHILWCGQWQSAAQCAEPPRLKKGVKSLSPSPSLPVVPSINKKVSTFCIFMRAWHELFFLKLELMAQWDCAAHLSCHCRPGWNGTTWQGQEYHFSSALDWLKQREIR